MSESKPCAALEWIDSDRIHGLREACANCPNRAPSAVEKELRGMVDALARQANEEEILKVYNAELVMGRDDVIKELRECLRDLMDVVMLWPLHPLKVRASALMAKK